MAITYDSHVLERLHEREMPDSWPREIIERAMERYRDTATGVNVAVATREYRGVEREIAVSYVIRGNHHHAITIHPVRTAQKRSRIAAGRWVPE